MENKKYAILESFLKHKEIPYSKSLSLKEFTFYKVGGKADFAVFPERENDATSVAKFCHLLGIPFYILGGGANVIVSEKGVRGVVCLTSRLNNIYLKSGKIFAQCGVSLENLAIFAAEKGIAGFEFAYNIPGSVGGAVIMNAGNNYGEFSKIVCEVKAFDKSGKICRFFGNLCSFGYRNSIFKQKNYFVLSAVFKGSKGNKKDIFLLMEKIKKERESKFPLEYPNAGSVFKRPKGYYAGKLIEDAGCGGLKVGDAMVSTKHKGFIVNLGNATAEDIKNLIALVQKRVFEKFGVKLEREQIFFPEDFE